MNSSDESYHHLIKEDHVKRAFKADVGDCGELLDWSIKDFLKYGDNYASIVTRVKVSYLLRNKKSSTSYIVKIRFDRTPGIVKDLFKSFFKKEVLFYERITPLLNAEFKDAGLGELHFPKSYYSFMDSDYGLLFLEDLQQRGFKLFRSCSMDIDHATLVVDELARFHAACTLLKEKISLRELAGQHDFLNEDIHIYPGSHKDCLSEMFGIGFETARELVRRDGGNENAERWLLDHKEIMDDTLERHLVKDGPFSVLCHGDIWTKNVLFRYDDHGVPVEVMMIDLQIVRTASLATDLRYMITLNLMPETKKQIQEKLLMSYHSSFTTVMKAANKRVPFSLQELTEEYKTRQDWGLFFAIIPFSYITMPFEYPDRNSKSLATKIEENIKRLEVTHPDFITKLIDAFNELRE